MICANFTSKSKSKVVSEKLNLQLFFLHHVHSMWSRVSIAGAIFLTRFFLFRTGSGFFLLDYSATIGEFLHLYRWSLAFATGNYGLDPNKTCGKRYCVPFAFGY
jgi:hypothetical protein